MAAGRAGFLETLEFVANVHDVSLIFTYMPEAAIANPETFGGSFDMVQLKHDLARRGEPLTTGYKTELLPTLFRAYRLKLVRDTSGAECEEVLRAHGREIAGGVPYAHERTAVVTNVA